MCAYEIVWCRSSNAWRIRRRDGAAAAYLIPAGFNEGPRPTLNKVHPFRSARLEPPYILRADWPMSDEAVQLVTHFGEFLITVLDESRAQILFME